MYDETDKYENLRERIHDSADISDADAEALDAFAERLDLLNSEYSVARKAKLLNHLVIIAESHGDLAAVLEDRDAAESAVAWINRRYDNEETNRDYRVALRVFGRHVTDGDDVPPTLEWIPSGTPSTHDPTPDPSQMLRWEADVQPMLEAAANDRDRAAVALQFDAGLRGGEFAGLSVGDLTDHKHGLQVTVEGKQGRRTVTLIPSVPYVEQWLAEHPAPEDPEAPLWCRLDRPDDTSQAFKIKMLKRVADRAGVDKPATPTNFRKSSAAHLASKGMNQAHLEDHHGWVRGSDVASRYVSVFAEESDRELARVYGADIEEEASDDEIAPLECPRCGEKTPREKPLCVWCGQALEPGAAERADRLEEIVVEEAAKADPADAEQFLDLRRQIADDPEALADAIDELR
ncbi:Tyrosine recombinase XerC protein [Halorhabdus tiamatea SARL4B]|uniref:Phage integrase n=1 Tax=Halorhabdus tiamatea SARL4B TaxID=1033806 RepID=F7PJG1_9EURY|nr:tyrosine-type recombinase/integrase [Halorhabdus tiamatea]ERJ05783.1 Tyrosine recombinase XerC protein [Halorhabdus tiamatea SARL4B]CCQ34284.1 phage integrase [Halorhabdus tiamatea SARL4B]